MDPDLKRFILHFLGEKDVSLEGAGFNPIQGDGSKRLFWRITLPALELSLIAMANPPTDETSRRENVAYVMIGKHLRVKGVPIPEIYRYELERGWFVMEDMGHTSLQELVCSNKDPLPIYERVLRHLFRMQVEGAKDFDTAWCCQSERYDHAVMRRNEADYFRDAFLSKYLCIKNEWPELETSFNHLAGKASSSEGRFFLHRDFQSRNILVSEGDIGIVDWQGGRLGPLGYDLASLLIDPYTGLSPRQKNELYQSYLLLVQEHDAGEADSLERYFPYLAIQRNLQILGAFSYLTQVMNKRYFESYIPAALGTLYDLLYQVSDRELSPLRQLVKDLQGHDKSLDTPGRSV
ncbi:MAG TPA: phosphotransferase [Thermodesulfobacteriota bacterium]|nr:phosphotransferase [Thermodesulfobacteriota bacterium]